MCRHAQLLLKPLLPLASPNRHTGPPRSVARRQMSSLACGRTGHWPRPSREYRCSSTCRSTAGHCRLHQQQRRCFPEATESVASCQFGSNGPSAVLTQYVTNPLARGCGNHSLLVLLTCYLGPARDKLPAANERTSTTTCMCSTHCTATSANDGLCTCTGPLRLSINQCPSCAAIMCRRGCRLVLKHERCG